MDTNEKSGHIYVMSDLHGCYDKFTDMLEKNSFSDDDTLYILGDIIDRGSGGIQILKYVMQHDNIVCLMGNHEARALSILRSIGYYSDKPNASMNEWISDGGLPTIGQFMNLNDDEKNGILKYMAGMGYYRDITIGEKRFILCHTVPEKDRFSIYPLIPERYYIYGEPEYEKVYSKNYTIVTGHTPTSFIDKNSTGKIWQGNNHIAIDCGAIFGSPLGCICLDTMEEFYV